jgi:hypothetical protein
MRIKNLIIPSGVVDNPSDEKWLKQICKDLGTVPLWSA